MGAFAVNDTSEIHIDDRYLTIRIAYRACAAWVWALITRLVQTVSKQADEATTVSLVRPWRYRALDWLSQIVYLLTMPVDHFPAQLDREIDFSFGDDLCLPQYKWRPGKPGRPPWPPRLLLLMFLYAVLFETVLVAELQINVAWRRFIGLGLLEKTPDHSTLCDFRQRPGPEVFVQVLARLLSICLERGLIRNTDLYFDFTAVHASGVPFKPYQRALLPALAVNRYLDLPGAKRATAQPPLETWRGLVIEVAMEAIGSKSLDKVSPERLAQSLARLEEKVSGMPQGPHRQEPVEQVVQEAVATESAPQDRKGLLRLARKRSTSELRSSVWRGRTSSVMATPTITVTKHLTAANG